VDAAKQSRDISEYAYRKGAASLLDFLDSERTFRASCTICSLVCKFS